MGNSNSYTVKYVAKRDELSAFVKAKAGRSRIKRIQAVQRAATMPNSLPPLARAALMQGAGK